MKQRSGTERTETAAAALPGGGALTLTLYWRDDRVSHLAFRLHDKALPKSEALSPAGRAVQEALMRLAAGEPAEFPELPLDWDSLPPFTRAVLETLATHVGHGKTITYGELAALCGKPGAARAVGGAMARNPWPLIVPCHRVLGCGGSLTGYTNPSGLDLKALVLRLEGAATAPGKG